MLSRSRWNQWTIREGEVALMSDERDLFGRMAPPHVPLLASLDESAIELGALPTGK